MTGKSRAFPLFETVRPWNCAQMIGARKGRVAKPASNNGRVQAKRSYQAASVSNLLTDWQTNNNSADIEARLAIRYIRNRTRDLERSDDYTRAFLRDLESNVIGHLGFKLMMKLKTTRNTLSVKLNQAVETAYRQWRQPGNYDVTGKLSGVEGDKLILRSVARDGDCLIRMVRGFQDNDFKFAFQLIESDQLDENYVWNFQGGVYIRMGVEMNAWRRPIAYHLWREHPGDLFPSLVRIRIPATEFIHPFLNERIGQSRGISWLCSATLRLRMLSQYEYAEVTSARAAAGKMGFFTRTQEFEYQGDGTDDAGNIITEVNPGTFENLPMGVDIKALDWQHPNGNYPEFRKAVLRGIASGLGIGYNTSFGDLEGVNYSSLRGGELDERETWLGLQEWFKTQVKQKEFAAFLQMAIMSGQLKGFSITDIPDICDASTWRGRRWQWVDPQKDIQSNIQANNAGFDSKTNIIESQGRDFEEVFEEIANENARASELGLQFITDIKNPMSTGKQDAEVGDDDTNVDITEKPTVEGQPAAPNASGNGTKKPNPKTKKALSVSTDTVGVR